MQRWESAWGRGEKGVQNGDSSFRVQWWERAMGTVAVCRKACEDKGYRADICRWRDGGKRGKDSAGVALDGVAQWVEPRPVHRTVAMLVPGQGTCPCCGLNPRAGCVWEAVIGVSLLHRCLSLSLSCPLSEISEHLSLNYAWARRGSEFRQVWRAGWGGRRGTTCLEGGP